MKIGISSNGFHFDSGIDKRFARCTCFVFYDSETGSIEFLPNPHQHLESDAGKKIAELMVQKGVSKVIAGDFGVKIKPLMDLNQIQMIVYQDDKITIKEIIDQLNHYYKP